MSYLAQLIIVYVTTLRHFHRKNIYNMVMTHDFNLADVVQTLVTKMSSTRDARGGPFWPQVNQFVL